VGWGLLERFEAQESLGCLPDTVRLDQLCAPVADWAEGSIPPDIGTVVKVRDPDLAFSVFLVCQGFQTGMQI
jgi:hypothetical protein